MFSLWVLKLSSNAILPPAYTAIPLAPLIRLPRRKELRTQDQNSRHNSQSINRPTAFPLALVVEVHHRSNLLVPDLLLDPWPFLACSL